MRRAGTAGPRLLAACVVLGGGAVLGGALLAPWIHRGLVALGRVRESWVDLRDLPFEDVVSRCVLLLMIIGLVPALRWGGVRTRADLGLSSFRTGSRSALAGAGYGILMIVVVLMGGWGLGAYRLRGTEWMWEAAAFLPAALLVGCIEEVLFRGMLFRALRGSGGLWVGVVISSALFSAVHFAAPEPTIGIAHAHWYSGLQLIPDTFRNVHAAYHYFPRMLTLFLMGVALCLVLERTRCLYVAIGLHAGWIWALRSGNLLLQRVPDAWIALFGWDNQLATGYAATVAMGMLVVGLLVWPRSAGGRSG